MARLALIAAALALLAGCVSTPELAAAPCVAGDDVPVPPAWAVDNLPADASPAELIHGLWAEHLQRRAYVPQLESLIGACIDR